MKKVNAYTLTELAIVVTIISVLLGMIISAQKFIKQNQNKKIISEIEKITQSLHEFAIKYSYFPGDFAHSSSYFTSLSSSYDGNGNGRFDEIITDTTSEAEIIPAVLNAAAYLPDFNISSDDQIDSLALNTAKWFFTCHRSCSAGMYDYDYADASFNLSIDASWTPALSAADSYNIDAKIDDSEAKQGKIMGFDDSESYTCTNGNSYSSADDGETYATSQSGLDCVLQINLEKIL